MLCANLHFIPLNTKSPYPDLTTWYFGIDIPLKDIVPQYKNQLLNNLFYLEIKAINGQIFINLSI